MKKVKDHLNEQRYWDIFTVPENASLFDAAKLMHKNKIGALMISKGDVAQLSKSSIIGILTERDIVYALSGGPELFDARKVTEFMTKKLIFTSPDTANEDAKNLMLENQIRHLPVFSDEHLVGIISMRDVFNS